MLVTLVLLIVFVAFTVGPFAWWLLASGDETAAPGRIGAGVLLATPVATFVAYNVPAPPTIIWAAGQLAVTAWIAWQWLVASFGFGLVYFLRLDRHQRARSGYVTYVGYCGRDFEARADEHRDDRSPSWSDWKADVDWSISGPAFRRISEGAARRHETRMIRTLSWATRQKVIPPIENKAGTILRGPFHPILRVRYGWLRLQGLILPARALKLRPEIEREDPAPDGLPVAPSVDKMGTVLDTSGAEVASPSAPVRAADPSSPSAPADPAPSDSRPDRVDPTEPPDSTETEPRGPVASGPVVASHPSRVAPPHPPVGGMPAETLQRDAAAGADATPDPEGAADVESGELVEDTGLADEVERWLDRQGPAEGDGAAARSVRGARGSSGGKAKQPPAWVQIARKLRGDDPSLTLGEVQETLYGLGFDVSRSTISRWLNRSAEGGSDGAE